MKKDVSEERFVEQKVTYTLEIDGRFVIVENVPARVSERTGGRFFSPETVESLQRIVWGAQTPTRVIQTPVSPCSSIQRSITSTEVFTAELAFSNRTSGLLGNLTFTIPKRWATYED